jgi:hypothetical protein
MNGSDHELGLRERLASNAEDRLGRAFSEVLESSFLSGALGRAFDAREKAAQAQELAMGALNLPSAADVERLTRRLRSVSQRLEGIEDGIARVERSLNARLSAIEEQLDANANADAEAAAAREASESRTTPRRSSRGASGSRAATRRSSSSPARQTTARPTGSARAASRKKS